MNYLTGRFWQVIWRGGEQLHVILCIGNASFLLQINN